LRLWIKTPYETTKMACGPIALSNTNLAFHIWNYERKDVSDSFQSSIRQLWNHK